MGDCQRVYNFILMPFISAFVGYITNVIALKMTFYPLEFTPAAMKIWQPKDQPFGLFGWQGIIPGNTGCFRFSVRSWLQYSCLSQ